MAIIDSYIATSNANAMIIDNANDYGTQTFTASQTYDCYAIELSMKSSAVPPTGNMIVSIRAVLPQDVATGKPTGSDIDGATGTRLASDATTTEDWVAFNLSAPVSLTSGTLYAIIIHCPDAASGIWVVTRGTTAQGYADGKEIQSYDGGSVWYISSNSTLFKTHDAAISLTPTKAENPTPSDAEISISPVGFHKITWEDGGGATSYDVYFGKTGSLAVVSSGQTGVEWSLPSYLDYDAEYSWRIDSVNSHGTTTGDIWTFTMIGASTIVRLLPFIFNKSIAYKIEMGDYYFRFYYGDAVLLDGDSNEVFINTPYPKDDLFEIQYAQIGDVMRLTHKNHKTRTLSRTSPTTFSLSDIDFTRGPFLLRNDLVDLSDLNPITLTPTVIAADASEMVYWEGLPVTYGTDPVHVYESSTTGTLTASSDWFLSGHVGCLFKLTHPRVTTIVEQSGQGTSSELAVKGVITVVSRGTWEGTFYVQRKEQNAEWENFRSYKGNNNRNIIESWTEENDTVSFRIYAPTMTTKFRADISTQEGMQSGILKITSVESTTSASYIVLSDIASANATVRWAEGAWSGVSGYPGSVDFFEDRCCYSGEAGRAET